MHTSGSREGRHTCLTAETNHPEEEELGDDQVRVLGERERERENNACCVVLSIDYFQYFFLFFFFFSSL